MVNIGGDSLEENFVFDDDADSQTSEVSGYEHELSIVAQEGMLPRAASDSSNQQHDPETETPSAKKVKLNWREAASSLSGDSESQRKVLRASLTAFQKYFPDQQPPFADDDLNGLSITDCSGFRAQEQKTVRDMLEFVECETHCFSVNAEKKLACIIITGSATRAMYIVKELREFNSKLSPLPLFFHGGGRKKEQSRTHESVLKKGKAGVCVAMPSRLLDICQRGLIDFAALDVVFIDLKPDEKCVNVLSQKDTMRDVLEIFGKWVLPHADTLKLVML